MPANDKKDWTGHRNMLKICVIHPLHEPVHTLATHLQSMNGADP